MPDDYLWDRTGKPDPETERLERALAPLADDVAQLDLDRARARREAAPAARRPRAFGARPALALAASVVAVAALALAWLAFQPRGWRVERLAGSPRVGRALLGENGWLAVGEWLVTDARSRARVRIGDIGFAEIDPDSRVQLVRARGDEHRIALERGRLHALIFAPPRRFFVDTPSAVTVDLGCAYMLEVDDAGTARVSVTSGWVSFEWQGRESFIPAGASCITRPRQGPGTPWRDDAPAAWREALARLDFGAPDAALRAADLAQVLGGARPDDALTLWHLLAGLRGEERERVFERLATLVPPPMGVTREGVLAGDRAMLDSWWGALGLGDVDWWRLWRREWPART